jgi:carbon monoxide dehydrogenase subunit G
VCKKRSFIYTVVAACSGCEKPLVFRVCGNIGFLIGISLGYVIAKKEFSMKKKWQAISMIVFIGVFAVSLFLTGCPELDTDGPPETPTAADYNVSGLSPIYDGSAKAVNISPKPGKSAGAITIYYQGTGGTSYSKKTAAPSAVGNYAVTFNVAEATGWNAVSGLYAGALTIANQNPVTPVAADFDISGLSQVFDGSAKVVNITHKPSKSDGTITIYYQGTGGTSYTKKTVAPSAVGAYTVTFDVAEAVSWNAITGLSAGTLVINVPSFTSIAEFEIWLYAQPENTVATPYAVALTVDDLGGTYGTAGSLGYVLYDNENKFVSLDLSGCTFTSIPSQTFGSVYIGYNSVGIDPNFSLVGITISDIVTSIEDWAFGACLSLASITIPNNVTSIGNGAFYSCDSIVAITIPDSVTSISYNAFNYCTNLTSVTFEGTILSYDFDDSFDYLGRLQTTFLGDLRAKFYATDLGNGTPGTYTTTAPVGSSSVWIKK